MFHLHSLKEPPPKRLCETINFTSHDIQSRVAAPSNPTTSWSVDSQRSCRDQYNGTIPTCGFQLSKKHCGKQNRAFQSKWFSEFPWLHYNEQSDSVLCFNPEREMIKEVITLCKLILVNPTTSAAGERSFSTARRLKTWPRSRMNQERFSNLTVLNIHKERTDRLSTIGIASEFTDRKQKE